MWPLLKTLNGSFSVDHSKTNLIQCCVTIKHNTTSKGNTFYRHYDTGIKKIFMDPEITKRLCAAAAGAPAGGITKSSRAGCINLTGGSRERETESDTAPDFTGILSHFSTNQTEAIRISLNSSEKNHIETFKRENNKHLFHIF